MQNNSRFWGLIKELNPGVILLEGTRSINDIDYLKLIEVGKNLVARFPNSVFRSGHAKGTDESFIKGVCEAGGTLELVLPFKGFRKTTLPQLAKVVCLDDLTINEIDTLKSESIKANSKNSSLIKLYSPAKKSLLNNNAAFLLRDVLKVTGSLSNDLNPASVALFYVNKENPLGGGTGHTIKVCKHLGVQVFTQDDFL